MQLSLWAVLYKKYMIVSTVKVIRCSFYRHYRVCNSVTEGKHNTYVWQINIKCFKVINILSIKTKTSRNELFTVFGKY